MVLTLCLLYVVEALKPCVWDRYERPLRIFSVERSPPLEVRWDEAPAAQRCGVTGGNLSVRIQILDGA